MTTNERTNLALGAGHLVQGLPLVGLGGKVELPQGDLHLPDPVRLRDLVPVKHLQHYRLLGHVSQRHLWVDSTVFSSIFQDFRLTLNWKDSLNVGLRVFLMTLVFNS